LRIQKMKSSRFVKPAQSPFEPVQVPMVVLASKKRAKKGVVPEIARFTQISNLVGFVPYCAMESG
jgi:hypothetical protein